MSNKYRGKYRNETSRLKSWDYGWNGAYFITICTKDRKCFFGDIDDDRMCLSEIGLAAEQCWIEIPSHFPFVQLGDFVVMPNLIHGIITIAKKNGIVGTQNFASLHSDSAIGFTHRKQKSQNIPSIIRGFKIGVTKLAREIRSDFGWQRRYHDHIIRNEESLQRISEYIRYNPLNWERDRYRNA